MPGKTVPCARCSKVMRSDNLKRHNQSCIGVPESVVEKRARFETESQDKSLISPKTLLPERSMASKNPNIQNLLNAVINDSPMEDKTTPALVRQAPQVTPLVHQTPQINPITPSKVSETIALQASPLIPVKLIQEMLSKKVRQPTPEVIADVIHTKIQQKQLPEPSPKVVADIFREEASSKPRTKGDLIGYSDDEGDPVTDEDDKDDESVTDENSDSEPDEIVIPDTAEGLRNRFNKLFVEFTREKKHDHRHELTLLLDEMLKHEAVTPLDYTRLNSLVDANLPERASDKEDEDDEGEEEEDYEKSTFNYIIQHDREELFELLEELKGDEEFIDEILNLEKLIDLFLENEFLEGEPTKKMLEEAIEKLQSPNISKSQKHRLKMLLGDISENRYRISSIFTRLFDTENSDQLKTVLKLLKQEELLSAEQFQRLSELEEPDASTIAAVVKETKSGQGVKFLPRTITLLQESLHSLLAELEEKGSAVIKEKLVGVLEELWRRHAISETGYNSIKETL